MHPIDNFPHNQKMAARRNQGNMSFFSFFSLKGVERKEKGGEGRSEIEESREGGTFLFTFS